MAVAELKITKAVSQSPLWKLSKENFAALEK